MKILVFCLFCFQFLFSQQITIVKILDSNEYLLDDGRILKPADLQMPSIHSPDTTDVLIAERIIKYAEAMFLKKHLEAIFVKGQNGSTALYAHIIKKYPLKDQNYNTLLIEKGYAKYTPVNDSLFFDEYSAAMKKAMRRGKGIWNTDTLRNIDKTISEKAVGLLVGLWESLPYFDRDLTDNSYQTYELNFQLTRSYTYKFETGLGILKKIEQGIYACDSPAEYVREQHHFKNIYHDFYIFVKSEFNYRYLGFIIGMHYQHSNRAYCQETEPIPVYLKAGLNIGLLSTFYFSAGLFDDIVFGPYTFGFNYKSEWKKLLLWGGMVGMDPGLHYLRIPSESNWSFGLKGSFMISGKIGIRSQLLHSFKRHKTGIGFGLAWSL